MNMVYVVMYEERDGDDSEISVLAIYTDKKDAERYKSKIDHQIDENTDDAMRMGEWNPWYSSESCWIVEKPLNPPI